MLKAIKMDFTFVIETEDVDTALGLVESGQYTMEDAADDFVYRYEDELSFLQDKAERTLREYMLNALTSKISKT